MRPATLLDVTPLSSTPEPWPWEEFAARLVVARRKKGLSREELAQAAHVDAESIRAYEQERRTPRVDTLRLIVLALDVSPAWLMCLSGERWSPEPLKPNLVTGP